MGKTASTPSCSTKLKKWEHPEIDRNHCGVQRNVLVKGAGRMWRVVESWTDLTNIKVVVIQ